MAERTDESGGDCKYEWENLFRKNVFFILYKLFTNTLTYKQTNNETTFTKHFTFNGSIHMRTIVLA